MSETRWNVLALVKVRYPNSGIEMCCVCTRAFAYNKEDRNDLKILEDLNSLVLNEDKVKDNLNIDDTHEHKVTNFLSTDVLCDSKSVEDVCYRHKQEVAASKLLSDGFQWTVWNEENLILDWHKFWSSNGEKLIWDSWIKKYSSYINPTYLNYIVDEDISCKFNLQEESNCTIGTELQRHKTSEGVKKLSTCKLGENDRAINDGWNSLSPSGYRPEADHLVGFSCASTKSSSKLTFDSMTNVTGTSLSSNDSSQNLSDSLSSVSLEDLSSSTAQEEEEEENENKWNNLWKQHYEEEYLRQYNNFICIGIQKEKDFPVKVSDKNNTAFHQLFCNNEFPKTKPDLPSDSESDSKEVNQSSVLKHPNEDEMNQMVALGLPLSFGKTRNRSNKELCKEAPQILVEQNSSNNKLIAAFRLIGMEFSGEKGKPVLGEVEYKRKNIRSQNALLRIGSGLKQSKHTHFDEEGNAVSVNFELDEDTSENITSDSNEELAGNEVLSSEGVKFDDKAQCIKPTAKRRKIYPQEINSNPKLRKYWQRRFSLFKRFDEGIKLDEESWYSVTPETIAQHTANRCKTGIVIDAFCGAGGNMIQFASTCDRVIAIDNDPNKIELAKNNAEVYGVSHKIEFIVGDFISLSSTLKADVVFVSPPWGGPSYLKNPVYDLEKMLLPVPFSKLLESCRKISDNIAMFLPRNSNIHDVVKNSGDRSSVEIEQNFINGKLIGITLYYSKLIRNT